MLISVTQPQHGKIMARIIVAAPQAVLFQTRIRVNIGDIN